MSTARKSSEAAAVPKSKRIGSIRVGCRLLRVLEVESAPLSLKELSARAAMTASKAHAYVATFVEEGLMIREPASGRYGLGPLALQLGAAALRQSDIIALAREQAQRLHEQLACSVFLSIWGNRGPTVIFKIDGRSLLTIRIGQVLPILGSASGELFLTHLPRQETEHLLEPELRGDQERKKLVEAIVRRVRSDGFAGMSAQGPYAGLAAPILRADGRIAASLSISRPGDAVGPQRRRIGALVKEAATHVSTLLGFDPKQLNALKLPVEEKHWN